MLTAHTFFFCGELLPLWHTVTDIISTTKSPTTFL